MRDVMAERSPFQSFFMAGFECSSHRRADGRRLDLLASTGHDRWAAEDYGAVAAQGLLVDGERLVLDALEVTVVQVSHDALEPTQFVFDDGRKRLGVLTDLGEATPGVLAHYRGLDALVIEANHDSNMLAAGPYPYHLKARVGGARGHLNNRQSAELVMELACPGLQHLVLAHLSEKNNNPWLARACFSNVLGCDADWLQIADQQQGLEWQAIA